MPIELVGTPSSVKNVPGTGATAGANTSGANLLVVGFSGPDGPQYVAASDSKSNADWVDAGAVFRLNVGTNRCGLSYKLGPFSVGADHTFTATGAVFYQGIMAAFFSGVNSFDQEFGVSNNAAGTSHITAPGTVSPGGNGALIISLVAFNTSGATGTITPPEGFNLLQSWPSSSSNWPMAMAYQIQNGATTVTPTWTTSSSIASCGTTRVFLPEGAAGGSGGALSQLILPKQGLFLSRLGG